GDRGDRRTDAVAGCRIDSDTAESARAAGLVRHVDIPSGIHRNAGRAVESVETAGDRGGRCCIAAATCRIDGYAAAPGWPAVAVRHVNVPAGIQREAIGSVQSRIGADDACARWHVAIATRRVNIDAVA